MVTPENLSSKTNFGKLSLPDLYHSLTNSSNFGNHQEISIICFARSIHSIVSKILTHRHNEAKSLSNCIFTTANSTQKTVIKLCLLCISNSFSRCISMTSLLVHTVAQPTKWRFLPKNLNQLHSGRKC